MSSRAVLVGKVALFPAFVLGTSGQGRRVWPHPWRASPSAAVPGVETPGVPRVRPTGTAVLMAFGKWPHEPPLHYTGGPVSRPLFPGPFEAATSCITKARPRAFMSVAEFCRLGI